MFYGGSCQWYLQAARDEVCASLHPSHAKKCNSVQKQPPHQSHAEGTQPNRHGIPTSVFCPDAFKLLGIPFQTAKQKQDLAGDGKQYPQRTDRIHWPKYTAYDDYCTVDTSDESVVVLSTDGLATLSLSPHEQVVRVTYPFVVPSESNPR